MALINEIIRGAMEFVLTGDTPALEVLRNQYKKSTITSIDKSSVGCFVEFKVDDNIKKIEPQNAYIGDVFLELEQNTSSIGVILFIENGVISMLEFYTHGDDMFPDTFENYQFIYANDKRDFNTYMS